MSCVLVLDCILFFFIRLFFFFFFFFFFFQAEDGIRDIGVTGVQTCALPIWTSFRSTSHPQAGGDVVVAEVDGGGDEVLLSHASAATPAWRGRSAWQIGRASCRERV